MKNEEMPNIESEPKEIFCVDTTGHQKDILIRAKTGEIWNKTLLVDEPLPDIRSNVSNTIVDSEIFCEEMNCIIEQDKLRSLSGLTGSREIVDKFINDQISEISRIESKIKNLEEEKEEKGRFIEALMIQLGRFSGK